MDEEQIQSMAYLLQFIDECSKEGNLWFVYVRYNMFSAVLSLLFHVVFVDLIYAPFYVNDSFEKHNSTITSVLNHYPIPHCL